MKHSTEYDAFTNLVDRVLAVPHSIIQQRLEEHREQAAEISPLFFVICI